MTPKLKARKYTCAGCLHGVKCAMNKRLTLLLAKRLLAFGVTDGSLRLIDVVHGKPHHDTYRGRLVSVFSRGSTNGFMMPGARYVTFDRSWRVVEFMSPKGAILASSPPLRSLRAVARYIAVRVLSDTLS